MSPEEAEKPKPRPKLEQQLADSKKAEAALALKKQAVVPMVHPSGGLRNVFESQVKDNLRKGWSLYEDYKQGKGPQAEAAAKAESAMKAKGSGSRGHPAP